MLWRGREPIARATIKDAVGTAIDGEQAHVLAGDGKIFTVDSAGAKVSWSAPAPLALKFVFRADRLVSVEDKTLTWSTPRGSRQVTLPRPVAAIGAVGDDVAIVDDAGDVRVLTGPTLPRPVWRYRPGRGRAGAHGRR